MHDTANRVWGVLDIDIDRPADFDETDAACLEELCTLLRN